MPKYTGIVNGKTWEYEADQAISNDELQKEWDSQQRQPIEQQQQQPIEPMTNTDTQSEPIQQQQSSNPNISQDSQIKTDKINKMFNTEQEAYQKQQDSTSLNIMRGTMNVTGSVIGVDYGLLNKTSSPTYKLAALQQDRDSYNKMVQSGVDPYYALSQIEWSRFKTDGQTMLTDAPRALCGMLLNKIEFGAFAARTGGQILAHTLGPVTRTAIDTAGNAAVLGLAAGTTKAIQNIGNGNPLMQGVYDEATTTAEIGGAMQMGGSAIMGVARKALPRVTELAKDVVQNEKVLKEMDKIKDIYSSVKMQADEFNLYTKEWATNVLPTLNQAKSDSIAQGVQEMHGKVRNILLDMSTRLPEQLDIVKETFKAKVFPKLFEGKEDSTVELSDIIAKLKEHKTKNYALQQAFDAVNLETTTVKTTKTYKGEVDLSNDLASKEVVKTDINTPRDLGKQPTPTTEIYKLNKADQKYLDTATKQTKSVYEQLHIDQSEGKTKTSLQTANDLKSYIGDLISKFNPESADTNMKAYNYQIVKELYVMQDDLKNRIASKFGDINQQNPYLKIMDQYSNIYNIRDGFKQLGDISRIKEQPFHSTKAITDIGLMGKEFEHAIDDTSVPIEDWNHLSETTLKTVNDNMRILYSISNGFDLAGHTGLGNEIRKQLFSVVQNGLGQRVLKHLENQANILETLPQHFKDDKYIGEVYKIGQNIENTKLIMQQTQNGYERTLLNLTKDVNEKSNELVIRDYHGQPSLVGGIVLGSCLSRSIDGLASMTSGVAGKALGNVVSGPAHTVRWIADATLALLAIKKYAPDAAYYAKGIFEDIKNMYIKYSEDVVNKGYFTNEEGTFKTFKRPEVHNRVEEFNNFMTKRVPIVLDKIFNPEE